MNDHFAVNNSNNRYKVDRHGAKEFFVAAAEKYSDANKKPDSLSLTDYKRTKRRQLRNEKAYLANMKNAFAKIAANKTVEICNLENVFLTEKWGGTFLIEWIRHNSSLKCLRLHNTLHFTDRRFGRMFANVIDENQQLTHLALRNCQLNRICDHIAQIFDTNKSITHFDISDNQIGDKQAAHLLKALHTNRTLKTLIATDNHLGSKSAMLLASIIGCKTSNLHILDIKRNHLGSTGWHHLIIALQNCKKLWHFEATIPCYIFTDFSEAMQHISYKRSRLRELFLHLEDPKCVFERHALFPIQKMLETNRSLQGLIFCNVDKTCYYQQTDKLNDNIGIPRANYIIHDVHFRDKSGSDLCGTFSSRNAWELGPTKIHKKIVDVFLGLYARFGTNVYLYLWILKFLPHFEIVPDQLIVEILQGLVRSTNIVIQKRLQT